ATRMSATPHISRNFKPAAIASLPSRIGRIKRKCYARRIMLCLCDNKRSRFLGISLSRTEFRPAYLLPIAWMCSLVRCSDTGFDVLVVFLTPFPPRTHLKVKLTNGGATVHLEATVIPPGAAISLPAEAR